MQVFRSLFEAFLIEVPPLEVLRGVVIVHEILHEWDHLLHWLLFLFRLILLEDLLLESVLGDVGEKKKIFFIFSNAIR